MLVRGLLQGVPDLADDLADRPGIVVGSVSHTPATAWAVLAHFDAVLLPHPTGKLESDLGRFNVWFELEDLRANVTVVAEKLYPRALDGPLDCFLSLPGADWKTKLGVQNP